MPKYHLLRHVRITLAAACFTGIAACQGVDVVFNEQVLHTSTDLFTEYEIPDSGLRGCIKRAILDSRITEPGQLRRLHCIEAGVINLEGLDQFPALERLDLTGNYSLPCTEASRVAEVATLILPDQCQ